MPLNKEIETELDCSYFLNQYFLCDIKLPVQLKKNADGT